MSNKYKINRQSLDVQAFYATFTQGKTQRHGDWINCCCPLHQETNPSFGYNIRTSYYNCFGCGEKGDFISFYMKLKGVNFATACKEIKAMNVGGFDE